ncbi:basic helix-loop-helix protein neurogenin-related [Holotrichia oblita]|uniref:Basic helix-loop-helix protein neurogenin-related n=1 Tax=Holotrichia oblita TaxID=644536 RepID=A0ACB9TAP9_HOLOL|nr:basic helix-loop-helix protein neurogenin-related [Holotrichia oblita]
MLQYDEDISKRLSLPADKTHQYTTDSNNNSNSDKSTRGDKYSLRPRSVRRRNNSNIEENQKSSTTTGNISNNNSSGSKTKSPKPKQKPAPLTFETLRKAVPQMYNSHSGSNEKLTKITTLRLAMKYISSLSAVLSGSEPSHHQYLLSDCSELDGLLLESDGESLPLQSDFSDHSLTPADFSMDFAEDSLTSMDFKPLSPDFGDHIHFDHFLVDFS